MSSSSPTKLTPWELYLESLKPVVYTTQNPRRSRRLAEKAAEAAKVAPPQKPLTLAELFPEFKTYVAEPVAEPESEEESEDESEPESEPEPEEKGERIQLISTYGANDGYECTGYALYRSKDMFEIICIDHCSCYNTVDILENYDEVDFEYTLENIISLATNKSDPRVPDIVTQDPHLLALYESILKHKDQLLTWVPDYSQKDSMYDVDCLDEIRVKDPQYLHKREN